MDKYGAGQDPYCYAGTEVLINKLNIKSADSLELAERDLTEIASDAIEFTPPPYDFAFLKQLHHNLFKDVYPWAGEVRSVDVSKGGTRFCATARIEPEAGKLFHRLAKADWLANLARDEFIPLIAEFCGDLNVIHPFREGNGRTMRLLCDFIVINAGSEIDWSPVTADLWLQASIDSVGCDYRAMREVFETCVGRYLPS